MAKGIDVYIAKQNMQLDGSMQAKITATVLGLAAEITQEFISMRTKEALAARKKPVLLLVDLKMRRKSFSSTPKGIKLKNT